MYQAPQKTKHYQEQQVHTASQEQLLLMLYDGAIRFCKIAKKNLNSDIEKSNTHLIKAQRIISEFMASLDMEIGGETAQNLFQLYEYLHHQLVQANIKKDPAIIEEVIEHLIGLRATWDEAIKLAARENKAASSPSVSEEIDGAVEYASRLAVG